MAERQKSGSSIAYSDLLRLLGDYGKAHAVLDFFASAGAVLADERRCQQIAKWIMKTRWIV